MRFRSRMAAPHFADAVAKYDAARIALFGVPYDHTCSFRGGSRFAPRAIREASYNFETYMMDHQRDLLDVPVADLGDTPAYGPTVDMVAGVTQRASDIVRAGKIPIVIGGEHSLAPAVGNPEPFGLSPFQVKELIGTLGPHLIGMDLNEISPAWDFGQTALLGARLIREAIMAIGEARA